MKQQQYNKKIRSVKPICRKRLMKRDIGGRKITIGFCGKIIKMTSQQNKERTNVCRTNAIFIRIDFQCLIPNGNQEYR